MKQIGTALITYCQDYDEVFVLATNEVNPTNAAAAPTRLYDITWLRAMEPYIKNTDLFVCPSQRVRNEPESTPNPDDAGAYTGSVTSGNPPHAAARSGTTASLPVGGRSSAATRISWTTRTSSTT
jgi:hypothetical protein